MSKATAEKGVDNVERLGGPTQDQMLGLAKIAVVELGRLTDAVTVVAKALATRKVGK